MANIKISQLPPASVVTADSDVLPMVHSGVTQKVTPDLLVQTVLGAPGPIGADVAGSAAFTTLTASGAVTLNPADANVALSPTGSGAVNIQPNGGLLVNPASVGSMNNVAIGGATPQPGTFTALTSTSTTTLNGTTIPSGVTLVDTDSVQTLDQKTLAYPRIWDPDRSNYYRITPVGNLALDVYTYLPVLTGNDYFSFRNFAETLTNKTISGVTNTLTDIGNAALTNSSITIGSSSVSLGGTLSSVSGLSINSSAIGASTASTGAFTTLSASSTVSGTGFSTYLASPPAIGGTTPAAGNFTTLGATGNVTLGDASGDTLTINGTGVSCPNNLNFDSNTLFIDATNNRVGIGTSSPGSILDVRTAAGTAATLTLYAGNNTTASKINFGQTGSIGWNSGITATNGFYQIDIDGGGTAYTIGRSGAAISYHAWSTSGTERLRISSTGVVTIGSAISLDPTTANALVVNSSGNVGIGAAPDSSITPRLYVAGTFGAANAATGYGGLYIASTDSVAANKGGVLSLGGVYVGTADTRYAAIAGLKDNATSNEYGGYLALYTRPNGDTPKERARITSAGDFISTVNGTAPSLSTNGTMVFNLTSNTNLRVSVRGTDGVTRTANITLA